MATIQKRKNKNGSTSYRVMIRPQDGLPTTYKTFPTFQEAKDWSLNLAYTSQNRSKLDRIIDKKWDLIDKLGGNSDDITQKPLGMHHKTFWRMQEEIWRLNELAEQGIIERFGDPTNLLLM